MNITVKPLYTGLLGERKLARYITTRYTSIERFTWSQFLVNNRSSVSYTYYLYTPLTTIVSDTQIITKCDVRTGKSHNFPEISKPGLIKLTKTRREEAWYREVLLKLI